MCRISSIPQGSCLTLERLKALDIRDQLQENKVKMLYKVLINYKEAIVFNQTECSKIHKDVSLLIVIRTILYKAQQEQNFPCLKALLPTVIQILRDRIQRRVLEKCYGLYQNPQFLVKKKVKKTYQLINAIIKINLVTLQDTNLLLTVNKFLEEFTRCYCALLIDFFLGYNQLTLDKKSKDITAFITLIRLL